MSPIFLRPVEEADRPALTDLWVTAWTQVLPQVDFAIRRAWFLDHWRGLEAGGAVTIVADTAAAPQGFMIFHPASGYVDQIAVASAAQGSGLAKLLLDWAKTRCREGLSLKVNQDNPRAVRFYQREGFVICGQGISAASGLALWDMAWTKADRDERSPSSS